MKTIQPFFSGFSQFPNHFRQLLLALLSTLLLVACSSENSNNPPLKASEVQLSSELKTIYSQTCAACHTQDTTGAPMTGDTEKWRKILSKGIEPTLDRVVNGYGRMPPGGLCFQCSPEQFTKLIHFMAYSKVEPDTEANR